MPVRGRPRGGRGSGRGAGRGRGRGSKTTTWEWHNNYSPGPQIYDQLWHVRKEPATVTPNLPTECPLRNAQSRITDRRQTEGEIQRNFYVVEVTSFNGRKTSMSSVGDEASSTELYHVDLSRILEYVSPNELERFENKQFQIEAEAEAVAMRIETEEVARRRLEKNARAAATGQGSRMLKGLGLDGEIRTRGRPRGRGRGRGGRGWRGRGPPTMTNVENMREDLVDAEDEDALHREEEMQLIIAETESEEDDLEAESQARISPTVARSAFVANSALPNSPVLAHRRPPGISFLQREPTEASDDEESDIELIGRGTRSMSSAAIPLRVEDDDRVRSLADSEEEHAHSDSHSSKRRRTETTAPNQRPEDLETKHDNINVPSSPAVDRNGGHQSQDESGGEGEAAEEYVVETIVEHYREAGKKYYLVKWQGYEDSHDWLPEEDLGGAAELVAEYNEKVRRRKLQGKQKMTK